MRALNIDVAILYASSLLAGSLTTFDTGFPSGARLARRCGRARSGALRRGAVRRRAACGGQVRRAPAAHAHKAQGSCAARSALAGCLVNGWLVCIEHARTRQT